MSSLNLSVLARSLISGCSLLIQRYSMLVARFSESLSVLRGEGCTALLQPRFLSPQRFVRLLRLLRRCLQLLPQLVRGAQPLQRILMAGEELVVLPLQSRQMAPHALHLAGVVQSAAKLGEASSAGIAHRISSDVRKVHRHAASQPWRRDR